MKLYMGASHSGNSHKIRILLGVLGLVVDTETVNLGKREHKSPAFLAINPRGQVPVLVDGETTLWDSGAIMMYLARRADSGWMPEDARHAAEVVNWLALAGSEIQFGLQYGRRGRLRGQWAAGDAEQTAALGSMALACVERRVADADWLVGDRPTIADIACFPYVETAPQAGVDLASFPAAKRWIERCLSVPGWASRDAFAY